MSLSTKASSDLLSPDGWKRRSRWRGNLRLSQVLKAGLRFTGTIPSASIPKMIHMPTGSRCCKPPIIPPEQSVCFYVNFVHYPDEVGTFSYGLDINLFTISPDRLFFPHHYGLSGSGRYT